jgi:hypothetical protein
MEECINSENREEFYEGQEVQWENGEWEYQHTGIKIERIVSMLCSEGHGFPNIMFPRHKAFLCLVKNIPFRNPDDSVSFITRYCVIGNKAGPRNQFVDWCLDPPGNDGDGWDDSDIFSPTKEEAVRRIISEIENNSKSETLCKYCLTRQQCIDILNSLLNEA